MSEDGRLNDLRERILEAVRNEKNGVTIFSMGAVLVYVGLVISLLGNSILTSITGILAVCLGTVSTFLGFYLTLHFARRYNNLLEEVNSPASKE